MGANVYWMWSSVLFEAEREWRNDQGCHREGVSSPTGRPTWHASSQLSLISYCVRPLDMLARSTARPDSWPTPSRRLTIAACPQNQTPTDRSTAWTENLLRTCPPHGNDPLIKEIEVQITDYEIINYKYF